MNRNATLNILRRYAHFLIVEIKSEKKLKGVAWERAVPAAEGGEEWFKIYCDSKRTLSGLRKELKNLNELIKFIKKNIK